MAVGGTGHGVPCLLQRELEDLADMRLVVYDENLVCRVLGCLHCCELADSIECEPKSQGVCQGSGGARGAHHHIHLQQFHSALHKFGQTA